MVEKSFINFLKLDGQNGRTSVDVATFRNNECQFSIEPLLLLTITSHFLNLTRISYLEFNGILFFTFNLVKSLQFSREPKSKNLVFPEIQLVNGREFSESVFGKVGKLVKVNNIAENFTPKNPPP